MIKYAYETSRGHFALNPALIIAKGLNKKEVEGIIALHTEKDLIFDEIEKTQNKNLLKKIEEIEGKLQIAWKFRNSPNPLFFEHWKVPGCSCPVLDNIDDQGFRKHYSDGCKWHGGLIKNERNRLTSGESELN